MLGSAEFRTPAHKFHLCVWLDDVATTPCSCVPESAPLRYAPLAFSATALLSHAIIARPYGGFIQQTPDHSCARPSTSFVKNTGHLAFSGVAHTSSVKPNRACSLSNRFQASTIRPRF